MAAVLEYLADEGLDNFPTETTEIVPEIQRDSNSTDNDDTSRHVGVSRKIKKQRWTNKEDEILISCYMNTSTNVIIDTNQKYKKLWNRVFELYSNAQKERPFDIRERTINMIRGRWDRMTTSVAKFVGAYDEALRRVGNQSDYNDEDVIKHAIQIYESTGKNFNDKHAWMMLKEYPKWQEIIRAGKARAGKILFEPSCIIDNNSDSGTSGKKIKLNDGRISTPIIDDGGEGWSTEKLIERPIEVKASKAAIVSKDKHVSFDSVSSGAGILEGLPSVLQISSQSKTLEFEIVEKKIMHEERLHREKMQMKERQNKFRLLERLLGKPTLTEKEEMIKDRLLEQLND